MPDHYPVNKIVTTTRPNRHGNLTSSNQALSKSTAHTIKIQNSPARARRKLRFHSLARLLSTTLARTFHKTSANSSTSQRKQKTQERLPPPTPHLHDERETIIHEPLSNTKTLRYSHTYTTTQRQKTKKKKKLSSQRASRIVIPLTPYLARLLSHAHSTTQPQTSQRHSTNKTTASQSAAAQRRTEREQRSGNGTGTASAPWMTRRETDGTRVQNVDACGRVIMAWCC